VAGDEQRVTQEEGGGGAFVVRYSLLATELFQIDQGAWGGAGSHKGTANVKGAWV